MLSPLQTDPLSLHDALPILTVDLARIVAPGPVTGVDVSAEVIEEARAHGGGAVSFEVGDFRQLDGRFDRSEEHTSELQSRLHLVCRLLLEKKNSCGCWRPWS